MRTSAHLPIYKGIEYSTASHGTIGNQDAYYCGT
jgi:hypothetical protein